MTNLTKKRILSSLGALLMMTIACTIAYNLRLDPPHNIYVSMLLGVMAGVPAGLLLMLGWIDWRKI